MARPATATRVAVTNLTIFAYPDSTTSTCTFGGDPRYVTTLGDILLYRVPGRRSHITIVIQSAGYTFDTRVPLVIADTPANKTVPGAALPGNFTNVTVSPAPPAPNAYTQLDFDDDNQGDKHFYYTLNFVDPAGVAFAYDPIILNN
jgi:hypothetical protein